MNQEGAKYMIPVAAILLLFGSAVAFGSRPATPEELKTRPTSLQAKVQRGEYLVTIGGCNDCHTPFKMGPNGPEPDMSRALSGHPQDVKLGPPPKMDGGWVWAGAGTNTAFAGPWGISYALNLTSDPKTGLTGVWTEEQFMNTIRSGKHWGTSRPILPPMPWFNYAKATDEDLSAIYAYLRSIPKIENQPPTAVIADGS